MTKVVLGRYAAVPGRFPYSKDTIFHGADAFWEPNSGVYGVATSWHHYHLYPVSERDVQATFDILRAALSDWDAVEVTGTELLQGLLRAVHCSFAEIDIRAHIAGIEFEPIGLIDLPEPADDPESKPMVQLALLQFQGRHLSIASVGNFLVYVVRSTEQELIFGFDSFSGTHAAGIDNPFWGPHLVAGLDMPEMYSWEMEVRPGDLIIATTPTMGEIVTLARLKQFTDAIGNDPKTVNRHLIATLKSIVPDNVIDFGEPYKATKGTIGRWGAAWAIARVER